MKLLVVDTNAYTAFLSGNTAIQNAFAEAETIFMSVIVIGELTAGFYGGTRENENRKTLERFLRKPTVKTLPVTAETAELFGFIKNNLKRAGTPIPVNDIWIAAHAFETGSVLMSFDGHFQSIPNLRLWHDSN